ncbi:MAG: ROK family protein [Bacillaceae bacterium]
MKKCISLDIGGTYIKYGMILENGELLSQGKQRTTKKGAASLLEQIIVIIAELLKDNPDVICIGISSAGQIDSETGTVLFATDNLKGWTGVQLKEIVETTFGLICHVENDVNAAALGELYFGKHELHSFLCLTYGTGIGGAIIQQHKLLSGNHFCAGEFGHMIVEKKGRTCNCGNRGCYEQYASINALINGATKQLSAESFSAHLGAEWLFDHYDKNERVRDLLDDYFYHVSLGLVNLIHIFNPPAIILGGAISKNNLFISKVKEFTFENIMPSFRKDLRILAASLHNDASLLGAAIPFLKGVTNDAATNY